MEAGVQFKRLRWKCRRGMRELDGVLLRYLEQRYERAGGERQKAFQNLLEMQDPELYGLLLGRIDNNDKGIMQVVSELREISGG